MLILIHKRHPDHSRNILEKPLSVEATLKAMLKAMLKVTLKAMLEEFLV